MNRRGFISLMGGLAAAPLVPWRGLIEPLISLPPRSKLPPLPQFAGFNVGWVNEGNFSNRLTTLVELSEASLEGLLQQLRDSYKIAQIVPTRMVVSPQVKHLIDTDPMIREAAEMVLGHNL